ncbi:MAG: CoA protein activase [Bacillota bacterium]|nr:CoA protein activase [Bacillota bacterium]
MKITFPHMGKLVIPLEAIFSNLKITVVPPPATTKETIKKGALYAPEQICLPFKINLGNLIEAYDHGADTMIMLGGCGPCRFGYYGTLLNEILTDLGINYTFFNLDQNLFAKINSIRKQLDLSWIDIYRAVNFGWEKLLLIEQLEDISVTYSSRFIDLEKSKFDNQIKKYLEQVEKAGDKTQLEEIKININKFQQDCYSSPLTNRYPIKIALVGDIYTLLEPQSNFFIERELVKRNVTVLKTIKISDWLKTSLVGFERSKEGKELLKLSKAYLQNTVGGHGLHTIGNSIKLTTQVDGVIQVMPFTCTPEIVAQSILPNIAKDYKLPILTLIFDEHSSDIAILTRIEAFIDLLERRKRIS